MIYGIGVDSFGKNLLTNSKNFKFTITEIEVYRKIDKKSL
jgi:hypothetical protein